jgi:outer membrane protein insertion porin family
VTEVFGAAIDRAKEEISGSTIVRASQSKLRLPEDIRSSLGLEFRVQMPVTNVPFRLIFAHNPGAEDNVYPERKNVVRFSVGRTF